MPGNLSVRKVHVAWPSCTDEQAASHHHKQLQVLQGVKYIVSKVHTPALVQLAATRGFTEVKIGKVWLPIGQYQPAAHGGKPTRAQQKKKKSRVQTDSGADQRRQRREALRGRLQIIQNKECREEGDSSEDQQIHRRQASRGREQSGLYTESHDRPSGIDQKETDQGELDVPGLIASLSRSQNQSPHSTSKFKRPPRWSPIYRRIENSAVLRDRSSRTSGSKTSVVSVGLSDELW